MEHFIPAIFVWSYLWKAIRRYINPREYLKGLTVIKKKECVKNIFIDLLLTDFSRKILYPMFCDDMVVIVTMTQTFGYGLVQTYARKKSGH